MTNPAARLMIAGTGSGVGKSVITAGLGRLFQRAGHAVVPFKGQNMSNNAEVAVEGGEIGTSQAVQARACRVPPSVHFNPVLLKPTRKGASEVVVQGRAEGTMNWKQYRARHERMKSVVLDSFRRIEQGADIVLLEGAGSPAEPNLMDRDLVNLPLAEEVDAPVLLVGDISRGGVFAWLLGTLRMLPPDRRNLIQGMVINKFRGNRSLLNGAIRELEDRLSIPVVGVLPHASDLDLPSEDSQQLESLERSADRDDALNVSVVRLPRIANFTDLQPLAHRPDVNMRLVSKPRTSPRPDLIVLAGTKNTIGDLRWMKKKKLTEWIHRCLGEGSHLLGLCGGYQMMGRSIADPQGLESGPTREAGLGCFDFRVVFQLPKRTRRVRGHIIDSDQPIRGYEIRYGRFRGDANARPWLCSEEGKTVLGRRTERCWGTPVHGLFRSPGVPGWFLNRVREQMGRPALSEDDASADPLDRWADRIETHLNLREISSWMGIAFGESKRRKQGNGLRTEV